VTSHLAHPKGGTTVEETMPENWKEYTLSYYPKAEKMVSKIGDYLDPKFVGFSQYDFYWMMKRCIEEFIVQCPIERRSNDRPCPCDYEKETGIRREKSHSCIANSNDGRDHAYPTTTEVKETGPRLRKEFKDVFLGKDREKLK
jgi:hypothetical protein